MKRINKTFITGMPAMLIVALVFGMVLAGCKDVSGEDRKGINAAYTVDFDLSYWGAVDTPASQSVKHGERATEPAPPAAQTGFTFDGWFTEVEDGTQWDFDTAITANRRLYARWTAKKEYILTFDSKGGSDVLAIHSFEGNKSTPKPPDPQKEGYTFVGWFADDALTEPFDFDAPPTSDKTAYAKWVAE
jgi:uncharacterized repeat protein (TIGR02543 family)